MIHPGKPGDDGDAALDAAFAAADEDMLSAISNGLDLDIGLARVLEDLSGSPATHPGIQAQVPAWPGEARGIPDAAISRNPSSRIQPRGSSGTAVRHSSRRTALLLLWLALPAVALGVAVYFLFPLLLSRSAASAAYLILAVFLAVLVLGVVAMVAVAVRREDRCFSSSSAAPRARGPGGPVGWSVGWSAFLSARTQPYGRTTPTGLNFRVRSRCPETEGSPTGDVAYPTVANSLRSGLGSGRPVTTGAGRHAVYQR